MIFDAHAHVYPDSPGFWKAPSSAAQLLAAMDAAGVATAAVIAISPAIPVEVVAAAAAAHPTRIVAIGSIDPRSPDALEEIDRQVHSLGVRGFKVHPRLQAITLADLPTLAPIAERCGALGVPLVVCTFPGGRELFTGRLVEICHELAMRHPGTSIVMAHAGGYKPLDALMVMKACPNVFVDLSFSPIYFAGSSVVQDFEYLVRRANPRRVLFGSDFPEAPIDQSLRWLHHVFERAGTSLESRNAILHDNAARLFAHA